MNTLKINNMQLDKNYWLEPDEMQWVLHYENTYLAIPSNVPANNY